MEDKPTKLLDKLEQYQWLLYALLPLSIGAIHLLFISGLMPSWIYKIALCLTLGFGISICCLAIYLGIDTYSLKDKEGKRKMLFWLSLITIVIISIITIKGILATW